MQNGRLYTSTELMEAAGCTRKAFRCYREKGLLSPRTEVGRRRYDAAAFNRLRLIVSLRQIGMSLDEIKRLLDLHADPDSPAGPVARRLSDELSDMVCEVTERIESLTRVRNRLVEARESLRACSTCDRSLQDCQSCERSIDGGWAARSLLVDR
jgi:DNA-binding transcriptional MerR regulator